MLRGTWMTGICGSADGHGPCHSGAMWQELGDGCFRRRYPAFDLNIGVVRGRDGLLVVDTRADLSQADELLDDLAYFGRPVSRVVNSHWHFDHVFGNQRFVERAAGVEGGPEAAEVSGELELWGHVDLPTMLLDNEDHLRSALRAFYSVDQADRFDRVVLTPPDHLVVDRSVLDLGDRSVELTHLGRGHTSNDLVVLIADAAVVFAGDLLEEAGPPVFGDDSYPLEWPATVRALTSGDAETYLPGHGDIMSAAAAIEQAEAIATVAALIMELHAAGVACTEALREAAHQWPYPSQTLADAVRRGYQALD